MFYQAHHSLNADDLKVEQICYLSYPSHLHNDFEMIAPIEGSMEVGIDNKKYTLFPGEACLIFPNQIHSLSPKGSYFLMIFSPKFVQSYARTVASVIPNNNVFTPEPFYRNKLLTMKADNDPIFVKGILYSLCGEFHKDRAYLAREERDQTLLLRIFRFVDTHFTGDCTLEALATEISYHYVYLSKYFKECTGIAFTQYVNRYRINEACYLLRNTDKTVLQTACDCGFDSLRSFNRNFKMTMDVSPTEYREKNRILNKDTENDRQTGEIT